jgi:NAD(P)-dependent dehydrogenase (short-subunit alcohol dehydrogenase family)
MKRRRAGSIVFTGARAVGTAVPGLAHYLAAKSALHSFAACLHAELAASGIGVAVVAPAALATDSNRRSSPKAALLPLELVASTLLEAAAGRLGGGAPLYRVPPEG